MSSTQITRSIVLSDTVTEGCQGNSQRCQAGGGSAAAKEPGAALIVCERSLLIPRLGNANEGCCCRLDVIGKNFWPLEQDGGKVDIMARLLSFTLAAQHQWTPNTNLCPDHVTDLCWWCEKGRRECCLQVAPPFKKSKAETRQRKGTRKSISFFFRMKTESWV